MRKYFHKEHIESHCANTSRYSINNIAKLDIIEQDSARHVIYNNDCRSIFNRLWNRRLKLDFYLCVCYVITLMFVNIFLLERDRQPPPRESQIRGWMWFYLMAPNKIWQIHLHKGDFMMEIVHTHQSRVFDWKKYFILFY